MIFGNYDGQRKEPVVLPSRFPNILVNGNMGIAVGMATNIPPHNLGEVIDGCVAYIDNPEITVTELMQYIKGPDFLLLVLFLVIVVLKGRTRAVEELLLLEVWLL